MEGGSKGKVLFLSFLVHGSSESGASSSKLWLLKRTKKKKKERGKIIWNIVWRELSGQFFLNKEVWIY